MNGKIIAIATLLLIWTAGTCRASGCEESVETQQDNSKAEPVDAVLEQLNKKTSQLKSYQGQIEYKFIQPLLESETLHKGVLYYEKSGGKSAMRINFSTMKQEDEKEQKYILQYIVMDGKRLSRPNYQFEGIWLMHLDYEIKEVKYYQLAEPEEPNETEDVFDLASRNLPMLGFTKTEDLKKQFEVELVEPNKAESENFIQVHLKVKPTSIYKDDYIYIDFWIDKKVGMPAKVVAVTTEEDIYQIKFLNPRINKGIDKELFEFKIPKDFGEPEVIPLKKKDK